MSVKTTKVCCQSCGADLDFSEAIRFVTCNFCGSKLEVLREPTITHTKVLDAIEQKTQEISDNLSALQLQNNLLLLDRNWDRYRESCLTRDSNGAFAEPRLAQSRLIGVAAMVLAGLICAFCLFGGKPGALFDLLLPILALVGFGAYHLTVGIANARSYEEARQSYARRRAALLAAMHQPQSRP